MAIEIERVFLLRGRPTPLPAGEVWRIDQGYLQAEPGAPLSEGRLRRIAHGDGRETYVHTVKRGVGLEREEYEQSITRDAFAAAWPRTIGRRLCKRRTRIREGNLTWEVDEFDAPAIVLAECELPAPDAPLPIPAWLQPFIEREVTEDPAYRNYELAMRARGLRGP